MEWPDFHYSPLEESLNGLLSPQMEKSSEWTAEENKLFENALAEIDPTSPDFFENVASRVPWKSVEEIKIHYQALVEDVEMIESGRFPIPDYNEVQEKEEEAKKEEGAPSNEAKTRNGQQRRRGVPWTEEEHQLFLMGLNKYGKGDWRSISRYYVITKTPTQVASHAQKYFRRQTSSTPIDRRRPSIHDIQTVNPNAAFAASSIHHQRPPHADIEVDHHHQAAIFPNFSSSSPNYGLIPMLHHHHNFNGGGVVVEQNPMFLPAPAVNSASAFPSSADNPAIFNPGGGYPSSSTSAYFHPSMRNQQWG